MENVFELVVNRLLEVGFYDLLIFVVALALFYGILKKTKLFEGVRLVNEILAFCIAFLIFGFPIILNYSLILPIATFFTHSFLWILIFFVGMLVASFFYPDLPKFLVEKFTSRSMLSIGIAIGLATAIISGLVAILWATPSQEVATQPKPPLQTTIVAAGVIIFVLLIIIAGSIAVRQ